MKDFLNTFIIGNSLTYHPTFLLHIHFGWIKKIRKMNNEYKDFRNLVINIVLLVIFFVAIGSAFSWELKKALLILLTGIGLPFFVAGLISFFIQEEIMAKIVSIAISVVITIITAFIVDSGTPEDDFIYMAFLIFVLTLGTVTINIFFLLKRFIKDDYKQEIEKDEIL